MNKRFPNGYFEKQDIVQGKNRNIVGTRYSLRFFKVWFVPQVQITLSVYTDAWQFPEKNRTIEIQLLRWEY